jgi:hypothetical protein
MPNVMFVVEKGNVREGGVLVTPLLKTFTVTLTELDVMW